MAKRQSHSDSPKLFNEQIVPAEPGSGKLFDVEFTARDQPVNCLGMTFKDDEARRYHFTEELRKRLKDPEFRRIEGFPLGEDDDILSLSDPPYYTACPNPWLADFVADWESQKKPKPQGWTYHREPFAADVSEGKNDPIYNAHSYHTKVPHKAIMRYVLHYTEPGDIVFDGFCGTGMTGVAAKMCGDREVVESLGFRVSPDGIISQEEIGDDGNLSWKPFSILGPRKVVVSDLSTAATFIAYNYNVPVNTREFVSIANKLLNDVENEHGWLFSVNHSNGRSAEINHVLYSDVFVCSNCPKEITFWDVAIDHEKGAIKDQFDCPGCGATLEKRGLERVWETKWDQILAAYVKQAKQLPVLISYKVDGKRYERVPSEEDTQHLSKCSLVKISDWFPTNSIPIGDKTGEPLRIGLTHVHHLYPHMSLLVMASIWDRFRKISDGRISRTCMLAHTAANPYISKLRRYRADKKGGGPLAGTLYIASLITPPNPVQTIRRNVNFVAEGLGATSQVHDAAVVSTQSCNGLDSIPNNSLDYVFLDPPFGSNLHYSELNLIWEAWLKVVTNNENEAIENRSQHKGAMEYRGLMNRCFREVYRVLKPGRWLTIEFSNTKAYVWNSIQTALTEAGFIVANVSALDKKQGSFNAVSNPTSVKQDLVISAYKPNGGFEERFNDEARTEEGVWDFVRTHLRYLPVTKIQNGVQQFVPERDPRILFDQMVAYYVRKGFPVPISSHEFQRELAHRFIERDGMYFLTDQIAEYDRKRAIRGEVQQSSLFVSDESSAIVWLRQILKTKPQTSSDINPLFMQQLGGWSKNEEQLDLRELLNQNFLNYDGKGPVPEQIHAYLSTNWKEMRNLAKDDPQLIAKAKDRWYVPDPNKAGDLEKLREKALLKEFEEYKESKKKLKVFRLEAVRAGFKKLWQERTTEAYRTIVEVAEKIPNNVLEEDPKLLMWYDQAVTRLGE